MSMPGAAAGKASPIDRIKPGIKITAQMSPEPSEEDLRWVRQMGVGYAVLWTDATKSSAEYYASRKELFAEHGIEVYGFGNSDVHNQDAIVLRLENCGDKVEEYKRHLQALGAGRHPLHHLRPHGERDLVHRAGADPRRGGRARLRPGQGERTAAGATPSYTLPLTNGREYSEEEIWDNFAYFIRQVAPVAEDEGVMIGIHPDDPPDPARWAACRASSSTFESYQRALEIADSPNVGVCLCVGCWLEGGVEVWGVDALEAIRTSASRRSCSRSTSATSTRRCRTSSRPSSTTATRTCTR